MNRSYQYFLCLTIFLGMLIPSLGNCSPINRDTTLIGVQVSVKNHSTAILEAADGDSIWCKVGCILANNMTVTKISRSGIMVRSVQGELFVPEGSNLENGGIKGDMLEVPVFEIANDPSSTFAAAQSNAFAPLSDISTF